MSWGLVICSVCKREVHQSGPKDRENGWEHCEDRTPRCHEGQSQYPAVAEDIAGKWCGADDLDRKFGQATATRACAHSPSIIHRTGGVSAKLDNWCSGCGERIVRKVPAGAWKLAETRKA